MTDIYSQWLENCLTCGFPAISADTAARILAVVYLCSNNENFTHNTKLIADLDYICKRWHIEGGESVDNDMHTLIKRYSQDIEVFMDSHPLEWSKSERGQELYPQWCDDLIFWRYGFHLFQ